MSLQVLTLVVILLILASLMNSRLVEAAGIPIAEARSLPLGTIVVNDGSGEINSFVSASTGIDVSDLSPGQTVEITGFSGQFEDLFEVAPRTHDDIRGAPVSSTLN